MGKADRLRTQSARQTIAAKPAATRRAETRRKIILAGCSIAAVLVLVVVLIVVSVTRSPTPPASIPATTDAAAAQQLSTVPAATFNVVGGGSAFGLRPITGQPKLTAGGKPELLYMGGEFCPFCAAERWAIAAAVSRFGTLTGLRFIHSSPTDVYPSTPTLTFYGSRYVSKYLAFAPVEWYGEKSDPSTPFQHVYLQTPTSVQLAAFGEYAGGSIPFVDIGNRYLVPRAQYLPSAIANLTWAQVGAAMRNPSSSVGKDIDGAANMISAAICSLTHNQPGNVCTSAGVTKARKSI